MPMENQKVSDMRSVLIWEVDLLQGAGERLPKGNGEGDYILDK